MHLFPIRGENLAQLGCWHEQKFISKIFVRARAASMHKPRTAGDLGAAAIIVSMFLVRKAGACDDIAGTGEPGEQALQMRRAIASLILRSGNDL
jgi:hypothetical protein